MTKREKREPITWAKIERDRDELTKQIEKMQKEIGGISNNLGDVAEEFFFDGLARTKKLGKVKFRDVHSNLRGFRGEYDIVLRNHTSVGIVEVKHKVHPNDIQRLVDETLPKFKQDFPDYENHEIYGAVAGFSVPKTVRKRAQEKGLYVFTQAGEALKLLNDKDFVAKLY